MRRQANPWLGLGFDTWMLGVEASTVISQRMWMVATGGPDAGVETARMISEKIDAGLALQLMAMTGGLGLNPATAAAKTISHYRRKVRANRRRLARA